MKLKIFLLLFCAAMTSCATSRQVYRPDQNYLTGLAALNFELWAEMSLGEYADDFSELTYEGYIDHAEKEPQFKEVLDKIQSANEYFFSASKNYFTVCLKYDADGYAVCDNASTPRLDKIEKTGRMRDLAEIMNSKQK